MTTFLQEILLISNLETVVFLGGGLTIIYWLDKKGMKFTNVMFIAIAIGAMIGLLGYFSLGQDPIKTKQISSIYGLIGYGYMDLLKMIAIPLVFFSMVRVIAMAKNDFKQTVIKVIGIFALTVTMSVVVTLVVVTNLPTIQLLPPGAEVTGSMREVGNVFTTLRGMIPNNIVDIFAKGNILAILVLAFIVGIAIQSFDKKKEIQMYFDFFEAGFNLVRQITMMIMDLMPFALIPLLANVILTQGSESLKGAFNFIVYLYLAMTMVFLVHLLLVKLTGRSLKDYLLAVREPLVLAFTSRSSLGTLPVTINTMVEQLHLPNGLAELVGSFGTTMGMNGCAGVYPTLIVVALASTLQIPMDTTLIMQLVFVVVFGSFGIAGIPGAATMSVAVVLSGMGMVEYYPYLGAILAIDPILDMGRTLLNVHGTIVVGVIAERLEK